MMSLKRIFGLMLLFLFFEAIVAVATVLYGWANGTAPTPEYVLEACLVMTGLAIAVWLIFLLLTRVLSRQRSQAPAAPAAAAFVPATPKASAADDSFTLEFTGLLNEANKRLASLRPSAEQKTAPTVQTLPIYLVIGAEGSGKTTVILNSGMDPRLLAGEAQRDGQALPTSLANFWFADGAIFIEIAGRVLMQDPDHWEKALRLLAARPVLTWWQRLLGVRTKSLNLRGVLLAFDLGTMLQSRDVHRVGAVARTLNERLQTVQTVMRKDFPTYVLLTRCDALRYFQEFFAALSEPESRRVLGVTLEASGSSELAEGYANRENRRLAKFVNRLHQSLADKRMLLLAREDSVERRALGYEFPRELRKVRGELVEFLLDLFRPVGLQTPLRLRGFYLTGQRLVPRGAAATPDTTTSLDYSAVKQRNEATVYFQAGARSTLDYSMVAKGPADTRVPKQTFLADLFRSIILRDPAGRFEAVEKHVEEPRHLNAALGVCTALLLMLSVIWVFSWLNNARLLKEVEAAVRTTSPVSGVQTPAEALSELESLRPRLSTLHENEWDGAPLRYRWGLYAGNRAASDVESLYYTRLRQAVMDPVLFAMNGKFMSLRADEPVNEDVYKELKSYRTITSGKCKPPDSGMVATTLLPMWAGAVSHDQDAEALASTQVQFYASELKHGDPYAGTLPENEEAVERAQVYLRDLSGPDKILSAVLGQANEKPAERLSEYASNYGQVLSGPDQVDGAYTKAGWEVVDESIRNHKAIAAGEACVVGKTEGKTLMRGDSPMDAQVRRLYADQYAQAWKQFLESHHVVTFTNTTDAAQKLRALADNNRSPLLALVYMTSANTNVGGGESLLGTARGKVEQVTSSTIGGLKGKLGIGPKPAAGTGMGTSTAPQSLAAAFDPVHVMVDPSSPNRWLNEKNQPYMKALGTLGDALQSLPQDVHSEVPPEMQELQNAKTALVAADSALHDMEANFSNTSSGVDVDLENLLREPIEQARQLIGRAAPKGPTGPLPPATPAGPSIRPLVNAVNGAAVGLCSTSAALQKKYPFNATSSTDASVDEVNGLLQPGTGAYPQFANLPDISKAYNHAGRVWAAKDLPATYSQPFVVTLNNLAELEAELYPEGSPAPHVDMTLTVDGTGKVPFELDVDGHVVKFTPGKQTPPLRLVWPPLTSEPTRLTLKTGDKHAEVPAAQYSGPWSLFRLLQTADDQNGNVFTFRTVHSAKSLLPLMKEKKGPATVQIRIETAAGNLFSKGYFAKSRCSENWALQLQGSGN